MTRLGRTFLGRAPDGADAWVAVLWVRRLAVIDLGVVPSPECQAELTALDH